jgi:hypothetical protein
LTLYLSSFYTAPTFLSLLLCTFLLSTTTNFQHYAQIIFKQLAEGSDPEAAKAGSKKTQVDQSLRLSPLRSRTDGPLYTVRAS